MARNLLKNNTNRRLAMTKFDAFWNNLSAGPVAKKTNLAAVQ
jgi:hypothetical protein